MLRNIAITAEETSPYWQCEVELDGLASYLALPLGTPFTVSLFGIDFSFVVDSRKRSRKATDDGSVEATYTVSGLSPLTLLSPVWTNSITKTWTTPVMASAAVTELVGAVQWNMIDWLIPGYRLAVQDIAPLDAARQIIEAAGGLLESAPNGGAVARLKWPVPARGLTTAIPDHTLDDFAIHEVEEQPASSDGYNRLRILDAEAGYRDMLEWIEDENDPYLGECRAYPSPWRDNLLLSHTRPSVIAMDTAIETTRSVTEIVEFKQAVASSQFPIMTLDSVTWLDVDLGGIVVPPYSTDLTAANSVAGEFTDGHSLANITYTTRYWSATITNFARLDTEAQLILIEQEP